MVTLLGIGTEKTFAFSKNFSSEFFLCAILGQTENCYFKIIICSLKDLDCNFIFFKINISTFFFRYHLEKIHHGNIALDY